MKFINGFIYISKFKIFIYNEERDGFDYVVPGKIINDRSFDSKFGRHKLKDPNKISNELKKIVVEFLFDIKNEPIYYEKYKKLMQYI